MQTIYRCYKCTRWRRNLFRAWGYITKSVADLENLGVRFYDIFICSVGSGRKALFWFDNWTEASSLASRFPFLATLDSLNSCLVADILSQNGVSWSWKTRPRQPPEFQELAHLQTLEIFLISNVDDLWNSKLASYGKFYVSDLWHLVDSKITCTVVNPTIWLKSTPFKVIMFIWRVCLDHIPSSSTLIHRGVNITFSFAVLCPNGVDSYNHIFASCPYVKEVLSWTLKWCGIPPQIFNSVSEVVNFAMNWGRFPKKRKIFIIIIYGMLLCI